MFYVRFPHRDDDGEHILRILHACMISKFLVFFSEIILKEANETYGEAGVDKNIENIQQLGFAYSTKEAHLTDQNTG